jgi:hypothetical protein
MGAVALTPSPENAAEIGAMVMPFVQENYGLRLDYSVQSLRQVDGIIDDLRQTEKFEQLQPLLFSMGCYVGEVLVRNAKARWRTTESLGMAAVASSPIVIEMTDGRGCNPVGKVYKRFQKGAAEDIAFFYHVMVEAPPALQAEAGAETAGPRAAPWPTALEDSGHALAVVQLMQSPDRILARQGAYLLLIRKRLQGTPYTPDALQAPLDANGVRTTIPLLMKDDKGQPVVAFTQAQSWTADAVEALRQWIGAVRRAGIAPGVPILVIAQHDSAAVRAMPEVQRFLHIEVQHLPPGPS